MRSEPAEGEREKKTRAVSASVFRQVYDSPASLPGKHRWVTREEDVRTIEKLLKIPAKTIGAPLWVSGDTRNCKTCGRETSWLDIVQSALQRQHGRAMIAQVILGDRKFVNTEAPRAISDLTCYQCQSPIKDLRSFKCHNWAYAKPALLRLLERIERGR